ncbi:MAG: hypothetical protein VX111_11255, partial [Planctomycetota bacterium]|nr:hypothetical protein [Planctomycetota bacterium]
VSECKAGKFRGSKSHCGWWNQETVSPRQVRPLLNFEQLRSIAVNWITQGLYLRIELPVI